MKRQRKVTKAGHPCRVCGTPISQEFLEEKRKLKRERIKATKQRNRELGIKQGAPRKANYDEIRTLRGAGYSMSRIASILDCSRGSVQRALKVSLLPKGGI